MRDEPMQVTYEFQRQIANIDNPVSAGDNLDPLLNAHGRYVCPYAGCT